MTEVMDNNKAHDWIANNSSWYTVEGNTYRAIVGGNGFEITNSNSNNWLVLYNKIKAGKVDVYNAEVDYMPYVPCFK